MQMYSIEVDEKAVQKLYDTSGRTRTSYWYRIWNLAYRQMEQLEERHN